MKNIIVLLLAVFAVDASAAVSFATWKKQYERRASKRGINSRLIGKVLAGVRYDPAVVSKESNQVILDKKRDYDAFIKNWMREDPSRIELGRKMLAKHSALLAKIEKKYSVDKNIVVALWGIETFYGRITGDHDLFRSLASLAYKGRRRKFYEIQLNATFRLLQKGHTTRDKLKGSWAGATGQCQMMPSNFNIYAQDFDGDGRKDIWSSYGDIFATIAYYMKKNGWKKGGGIGKIIHNSKHAARYKRNLLAEIPLDGSPVIVKGANYKPVIRWNNSSLFAAFNILLVNGFSDAPK